MTVSIQNERTVFTAMELWNNGLHGVVVASAERSISMHSRTLVPSLA